MPDLGQPPDEGQRSPPRATYRPTYSYNINRQRDLPPKGVRGGVVRPFPPVRDEVIALGAAYRAAGCTDDARYNDPPCKAHPYRVAIDAEVSD
jgi:hypothetical protein